MGTYFQPQAVPPCLRSLQVRSDTAVLPAGKMAPPLQFRWAGMILLPDPTVQFSFCSSAHIPTRNKGPPRFNAGCVLQTPPLEAGPELHCEALPTNQEVLSRLHDGGVVMLFYPGTSAPGFHSLCPLRHLSIPGTPVSPTDLQHFQSPQFLSSS